MHGTVSVHTRTSNSQIHIIAVLSIAPNLSHGFRQNADPAAQVHVGFRCGVLLRAREYRDALSVLQARLLQLPKHTLSHTAKQPFYVIAYASSSIKWFEVLNPLDLNMIEIIHCRSLRGARFAIWHWCQQGKS